MTPRIRQHLDALQNAAVSISDAEIPDEEGSASIRIKFANGTVLIASYWRLIDRDRGNLSCFDHKKIYGLPAPIDAKKELINLLDEKICCSVSFDQETADFAFVFEGNKKLQVFNFTAYEIWEIRFPDGTEELSNYALVASSGFQPT